MPRKAGRRLIRAAARHVRARLVTVLGLMGLRTAAGLAVPALLSSAVHACVSGGGTAGPVGALGAVLTGAAVGDALMTYLATTTAGRSFGRLQERAVRQLLAVRIPWSPGEATALVSQGVPGVAGLPLAVAGAVTSLVGSTVALGALWLIDWRVGLTFSLSLPLVFALVRGFVTGATQVQQTYFEAQADIAGRLLAALTGAQTIRAADSAEIETERVLRSLPALSASGRANWRLQRGAVWRFKLVVPLTQVVVLGVAGLGVAAGRTDPAELLAVSGYTMIACGVMDQIDTVFGIAQTRAGVRRLAEVFEHRPPATGTLPAARGQGAVSFRGVTVVREGETVLDGCDLAIPAGKSVALVGRTGSGKSLVASLIGRLTNPDRGEILLDGVCVDRLSTHDLRRSVSYAFERPVLIGHTVADAITYGTDLSRAQVIAAATAARADSFIRRLPLGYDTPLAQAPMSGGERQRLGLARALVRPAVVYVLDDATSGLDTVTEAEVTEAVTTLLADRTRLVVAHRAATAQRCDLVAWLDSGRIAALAPHDELWKDPDYRSVFGAQEQEQVRA